MNSSISRIISITRFPIILGPVLIHTHWPYPEGQKDSFFEHFCSGDIGFITVPLYYLVAGFLFFQNYDNTVESYKLKMGKRIRSLLVPYILWNLIAYLVYSYLQHSMDPSQFLESFWVVSTKGGHSPADGPLWFIRTLMLLMVASPIFYYIIKMKYSTITVVGLLALWILNFPGTSSGTVMGGVFFLIGCYVALNHLDEKDKILYKYEYLCYGCFALLIIADHFMGRDNYIGKVIYHLILFIGMLIYYYFAKKIPQGNVSSTLTSLGGVSFFVFAIHEMFVDPVQNTVRCFMEKGLLSYMVVFMIVTSLSLLISLVCKKFTPQIFKVLSGNR